MRIRDGYKNINELDNFLNDNNNVELKKYVGFIKNCLNKLYDNETVLFERNLCERCLIFRFAHHLQNEFDEKYNGEKYFIDCDYNNSFYYDNKEKKWIKRHGKQIQDQANGETKKRFIDIIVHKRLSVGRSDLICFETKKWNNCTKGGIKKDENNLRILTSQYGYLYGFHLIFGKTKEKTQIKIFKRDIGF